MKPQLLISLLTTISFSISATVELNSNTNSNSLNQLTKRSDTTENKRWITRHFKFNSNNHSKRHWFSGLLFKRGKKSSKNEDDENDKDKDDKDDENDKDTSKESKNKNKNKKNEDENEDDEGDNKSNKKDMKPSKPNANQKVNSSALTNSVSVGLISLPLMIMANLLN